MKNLGYTLIEEKAKLFKILSNNVRLCILTSLCINEEQRVNEIQKCTMSSQSFVSQQLVKLKDMGIITDRKEGNLVYYKIIDKDIKDIIKNIVLKGEK